MWVVDRCVPDLEWELITLREESRHRRYRRRLRESSRVPKLRLDAPAGKAYLLGTYLVIWGLISWGVWRMGMLGMHGRRIHATRRHRRRSRPVGLRRPSKPVLAHDEKWKEIRILLLNEGLARWPIGIWLHFIMLWRDGQSTLVSLSKGLARRPIDRSDQIKR